MIRKILALTAMNANYIINYDDMFEEVDRPG